MRPTLLPNLRRLWRDERTVQLGTDPATAIILELRRPELARVLDLLDGSHTEHAVLDAAEALGLGRQDARDLIGALHDAGLVVGAHALVPVGLPRRTHRRLSIEAAAIGLRMRAEPAPGRRSPADVLRRRHAAKVVVAGDGPLVAPLAAVLASAGVGHVDPAVDGLTGPPDVLVGGLSSADVDSSRAIATATAIVRFAPDAEVSAVRADAVDFVVRVGDRQPPALARRGVRLHALPRLDVTVRLGTVLVGPLVRPAGSPCQGCLDLHRLDRDPAWPALAAQLATTPIRDGEPCASTTALAGAAFAADEVLSYLDGATSRTEAAIVEIPRAGEFRRREWGVHPRCDCRRRRRSAPTG
ncbi:ThiF family adenylyltransferase [Dactylosporangium sp. AC04546]|uniref:ThiF family adenylyltransferase n=1 Tax=Dactylosporangium sp. AC04546 TaxID=2862460 RepID=UPI001EE0A82E|nr:ThiF family adenylyltransferase [Dactylosporangium sp. AC04546]WVK84847.1 ThiF family adenylyltransferase [Dactylosporangium sp. AC04546]